MFRFKREEISSSSNNSQSFSDSENSDTSVSEIIELVDKLQLNIQQVEETVLPSLKSDLKKLKKKVHRRETQNRKTTPKEAQTLQNNFKHISTDSKFGYNKGECVTI